MGDFAEYINYSDKRFDPKSLSSWLETKDLDNLAKAEADWLIQKLKPIANKCIGLLDGNHEESIRLKYHQDITSYIGLTLGIKNLGWSALINLFFRLPKLKNGDGGAGSYMLKMAVEHGSGGGYYAGGKLNKIIMQTGMKEADIFASGHTHIKTGHIEVMIGSTNTENPEPKEKPKAVIITGTYLRTYQQDMSSYAEKKSYRPTALGSPYLDIWQERVYTGNKDKMETKMSLTT